MKIEFSKSIKDIGEESADLISMEKRLVDSLKRVNLLLTKCPLRKFCVLCGKKLVKMESFEHRSTEFKVCSNCDHRQSAAQPTKEFETAAMAELGYDEIYPRLDRVEYISRRDRIYKPKLMWLVNALNSEGYENFQLKDKQWFELGAGSGYFLSSLQQYGVSKISGVDASKNMVSVANEMVGNGYVTYATTSAAETIRNNNADVYCAFFVLEHLNDTLEVLNALAEKPIGTIFVFSVPVFGLITAFESVLDGHAARNLDGMTHTQVYTDKSICFALEKIGFEPISQWVFGQDAQDLYRFLSVNLKIRYPDTMRQEFLEKFKLIVDPLQSAIDKGMLADARHIVAIKR